MIQAAMLCIGSMDASSSFLRYKVPIQKITWSEEHLEFIRSVFVMIKDRQSLLLGDPERRHTVWPL